MAATLGGHTEVVKLLLEAGADVSAKNKGGVTAQVIAKEKGHADIVALFGPPKSLVAEAQRLLQALGYDPGPVDGDFGPRTKRAIAAYQRKTKRQVDEAVSEELVVALREDAKRRAEEERQQAEAAWVKVQEQNTVEAYEGYLRTYPRSRHANDVSERIAALKEKARQDAEEARRRQEEEQRRKIEEAKRKQQEEKENTLKERISRIAPEYRARFAPCLERDFAEEEAQRQREIELERERAAKRERQREFERELQREAEEVRRAAERRQQEGFRRIQEQQRSYGGGGYSRPQPMCGGEPCAAR